MFEYTKLYQISFFASEFPIKATTDNISKLLDRLKIKDLIPSTIEAISISPEGQKSFLQLRFIKPDSGWEIEFEESRILISLKRHPNSGICEVNEFINEAKDILSRIYSVFPIKGNRLSFYTRGFLEEMSQDKLQLIYSKFIAITDFFKLNPPNEWRLRNISKIFFNISEISEQINVVVDINRVKGVFKEKGISKPFDRIEIGFDINTFQNNLEGRFSVDSFDEYFSRAVGQAKELLRGIWDRINEYN